MFPEQALSIPIQSLHDSLFVEKNINLSILRTDKTDPIISGNKWFKLKYNLMEAKQQGYKTLLSFGGPYSNHLHALASAGKALDFNTIGIIRGEEHQPLNPTLSDVVSQGMKLYYIDRKTYRQKHTPEVIKQIVDMIIADNPFNASIKYNNSFDSHSSSNPFYLVPEGGTNTLAIKGAAEITSFIPEDTDFVCVPCGTGGTMAGIIKGLNDSGQNTTRVLGFPAMKGGQFLQESISSLLSEQLSLQQETPLSHWQLFCDYHFGGFGKINHEIVAFINDFEKKHCIELDPIYTAKMMYAIVSLIKDDFFPKGSKIIATHTGGVQGKRGMEQQLNSLA